MTKGCLILHGLTGTPGTVATLKNALSGAGFRTSAPCLSGHGGTESDLGASTWQDWYETVRIAFHTLKKETEKVYCAGISLGALLSLKLALDEGWGVRALALLSTPLELSLFPKVAILLVRHSPLKWIVKSVPKNLEMSVGDPEGRERYDELSLPALPANAAFELVALQKDILKQLTKITNPIIMLHGRHDKVAPLSNLKLVKNLVASDIVETVIFNRSYHVLTMDIEKETVANTVVDFFEKFA